MFGINLNLSIFRKQEIDIDIIEEGDSVVTADGRTGIVITIAVSPYYVEERNGIMRAYVIMDGSADYFLASELGLARAASITTLAS